jgi:O-antigen/teichoic acid export membrane protein
MRRLIRRIAGAKSSGFAIIQTVLANVGVLVLNIISGIITARTLGPSGRGALAAILMWPQFLAYGLSLGVPVASLYWLKRRPDDAQQIVGTGMLLSAVLGTVAAVVGFFIIPFSLRTYPHHVIGLARSWVVVTPLALLAVTIIAQVQAAGAFTKFNLFRFLSPLSVLFVIVCATALGHLTFGMAALAYLLAVMPATIWIGAWVWRHYRPTLSRPMATSRLLIGYGVRAWGADLLATIASQVDRILVVGLLNPESMGLYVVAQSAAGLLSVFPSAVSPITLPQSSGLDTAEIMELTGRAVRATLYVMITASIPLFVLGGLLLDIVYGQKFSGASAVLPFLLVESIADGLTSVLAQAFLASGFPGTVTLLEAVGVSTSIPLLYFLIPRFGLRGAGLALMTATLCRFVLVLISFPRKLRTRPPGFVMPRREFVALVSRVWKTSPSDT